jgi:hypothetical protein
MSFDLSDFSIMTIGYREPTLWAAVALGSGIAIAFGYLAGGAFGGIRDRWRRRLYGVAASGLLALAIVVVTVSLLDWLFIHYHRRMVCTVFVTPALFLPAILGLFVESIAWRRARRVHVA